MAARNEAILDKIRALKGDYPFWTIAELQYVDGMQVNQKQVSRLMREDNLFVKASMNIKASLIIKPKPK